MDDLSDQNRKETWPWTRYFARKIDMLILSIPYFLFVATVLLTLVLLIKYLLGNNTSKISSIHHIHYSLDIFSYSLSILILIIFGLYYIFIDSLICYKFGRNLGHKIFGLEITNNTAQKLTYKFYLKRSCLVFFYFIISFTVFTFFIPAIFIYRNYKKNGDTYWDRKSKMSVTSRNASKMRTVLCVSTYINLIFILSIISLLISSLLLLQPEKETLSPQQKQFIQASNKPLPHRINNLVIANQINIEKGNVIIRYTVLKEQNAPLTNGDNIRLGIMKLAAPRTAINYLCTAKGKAMFTFGKEVVYIYTLNKKVLFQFNVNPSMCSR